MAKSLSARVAELETELHGARNRAAFLAVRDEVKQAIDDGWSVKAIWRTLYRDQKIAFGYEAFRKYVIGLIAGRRAETARARMAGISEKSGKVEQGKFESFDKKPTGGIRGFTFNPVAKKEDLF